MERQMNDAVYYDKGILYIEKAETFVILTS